MKGETSSRNFGSQLAFFSGKYNTIVRSFDSMLISKRSERWPARRPNAVALRAGLPSLVKAVAFRNATNHIFVPSKANFFDGLQYHFVMLQNEYPWIIQYSSGIDTGAVESSTLVIKRNDGQLFASMCLVDSDPLMVLNRRDSILEPLRRRLCEIMISFALTTRTSLLHTSLGSHNQSTGSSISFRAASRVTRSTRGICKV
jgi:hypothetical protein